MWLRIDKDRIEDLVDLPLIQDPAARATMEVLSRFWPAAAFTDENLKCLLALRRVNLSLEHGNSDASAVAYVTLGAFFGRYFERLCDGAPLRAGRHPAGREAGAGSLQSPRLHPVRNLHHPLVTAPPFGPAVAAARRRGGDQNGRSQRRLYGYAALVTNMLASGEPLSEVEREAATGLSVARKVRFGAAIDMIEPQLRLVRMLRGLTADFASFNDADFDEAQFEKHLQTKSRFPFAHCWYSILKIEGSLFSGDHASALAAAAKAQELLWTSGWLIQGAEYHFYAALAHAAASWQGLPKTRPLIETPSRRTTGNSRSWAKHCPENFAAPSGLVAAEIARIEYHEHGGHAPL